MSQEQEQNKSLDDLYQLWNDSQSYIGATADQIERKVDALQLEVTTIKNNLSKLLKYLKAEHAAGSASVVMETTNDRTT